jgi:hypothetical protein
MRRSPHSWSRVSPLHCATGPRRYHPDLLSIQELTPSFVGELRKKGIRRRLPHSVLMAQPKGHGVGLYARFPLTSLPHQTHFLFRMPRAMIVLPDGKRLRVVAVHPQPPNMSVDRWEEALESLPVSGNGIPWVLAGDKRRSISASQS